MKFSHKALLAVAAISVVHAQVGCEEDEGCIGDMKACTDAPDDCCEGFECHGYNFFKRCQPMPGCLDEWYACNPNPDEEGEAIECCDGFACIPTGPNMAECQKPTPRNAELPGFDPPNLVEPVPPDNPKTFDCPEPVIHSAKMTGDPHIRSFDGTTFDCQGVGEFTIFKSTETSRQVQGRFTRVQNRDVSVTHGVVMQDEGGASIPKVQVSIPVSPDEEHDEFTTLNVNRNGNVYECNAQLFVDNEQHELKEGVVYESDQVKVSLSGVHMTTLYKSGFEVKVTMGYWNGCLMNTYLTVPTCEGDSITGLLGDADGNANNDWITKTGDHVDIPSDSLERRRKPAYDWCVANWCITDEADSIFHYNQVDWKFGEYSRCALEYGTSLVEFIADLPADIVTACQADLGCMIDALADDEETRETAIRTVAVDHFELARDNPGFCTAEDGDCSGGNKCCDGLNCVKYSPTERQCKKGISKLTELEPKCNPFEGGYCEKVKCCGDMECVEKNGDNDTKLWQCEKPAECAGERMRCGDNGNCCDGMTCADPKKGEDGKHKVCLKLPTKSKKNGICFPGQACEDGLVCDDGNCVEDKPLKWGKKCFQKNWPKEKKCDEGLICMPFKNRKVCADPGLKKGTKTLKKGATCTIGDETIKCKDGYSCQKPEEKRLKKFIKNFGETAAMKIGQCKKVGAEKAIKEYREKSEKADDDDEGLATRSLNGVPKAKKCVMKRSGRALEYEPNFARGREDVYVQVEIQNDAGEKEILDFFPHNFPEFANEPKKGHIPILDQERFDKLYDEQTKLGGQGFRFRFHSKNGEGAWNSCSYSPIAFDLDHSGAVEHITSTDVGFQIDITGDGDVEHLSEWFAPTEGILIDLHNINATDALADTVTGHHMMGDMGGLHADGFDKLATYDTDQDGKLSGAELADLYVWVDANSNLLIDQGELNTVAYYNITALYTNHSTTFQSHADLADGTTMLMQDLWFKAFGARTRL